MIKNPYKIKQGGIYMGITIRKSHVMLEGKEQVVNELMNATFKKLIESSSIQSDFEFPYHSEHLPKQFYELLEQHRKIVNPFGNSEFNLKEPAQYWSKVDVLLELNEGTKLTLKAKLCQAKFSKDKNGWLYETSIPVRTNQMYGYLNIGHYYENEESNDEVIRLKYKLNGHLENTDDIDLRISLKTGLAWKTYKEKQAKLATDEQIELMITHLNNSIEEIKNNIIYNMISK
jgi:hypothetical protein